MPIKICPNCQNRYVVDQFNQNDYVHRCNSTNTVLDQEDVLVMGNHQNDDGQIPNGTVEKPNNLLITAGLVNQLQGTRAGVDGDDFDGVTERGNRQSTHRQRQYHEYIKGGN